MTRYTSLADSLAEELGLEGREAQEFREAAKKLARLIAEMGQSAETTAPAHVFRMTKADE